MPERSARIFGNCGPSEGFRWPRWRDAVGISVGFLSALERSQMSGSVGTLRKLARFYKTNILDFFDASGASSRQVRPAERKVLEAGDGRAHGTCSPGATRSWNLICFASRPKPAAAILTLTRAKSSFTCCSGDLEITVDGEEYRLKPGDSFYFESATPHRWKNPGRKETLVLWVNTPPTF